MFSYEFFTTRSNSYYCITGNHLKYFTVRKDPCVPPLPDPNGSLSKVVDRGAIEATNEEVMALLKADKGMKTKCSPYLKITPT